MQHLIFINYAIEQNCIESFSNVLSLLPDKKQYAVIVEPTSRNEDGMETSFLKHLKYIIEKKRISSLLLPSITHISFSRTQLREFLMHCKRSDVRVVSFNEPWLIDLMDENRFNVFLKSISKEITSLTYLTGQLPKNPRTRKGIYISR